MSKKKCDHHMEFHSTVTVGSKGQIVIPKDAREILDIHPGDKLVTITKGDIALGFIKSDNLQEMMNYLQEQIDNQNSL